jgi:hypothetical protein
MTDTSIETTPAKTSDKLSAMFLCLLGGALCALAVGLPMFSEVVLVPPKYNWLGWTMGVAAIAIGLASWSGAALWGLVLGTVFLGGAAQMWLTDPLWFPKLRLAPDGTTDLVAWALIGLQGLLAVITLLKARVLFRLGALFKGLGFFPIVLFLVLSVAVSVSPFSFAIGDTHWEAYAMRLVLNGVLIGINLLSLAALLAVPAPNWSLPRGWPVIAAGAALAASALLAVFAFEQLPHVEDEVAYLLQAKMFAAGQLTAPAPPEALRPGLEFYLMDVRGDSWIATPPMGWPAILTLGVWAGAPWLLNPVLAALTLLILHSLVSRVWTREVAHLTTLLIAVSPWYLGTAGALMPHIASLFLVSVCWWLLVRTTEEIPPRAWVALALVAGLAMGWVFVIRQLEGVILGTLTGLWLLRYLRAPGGMTRIMAYSLGCVVAGAAYLWQNYALTGSPLEAPLARYLTEYWTAGANTYGFGEGIGPPQGWGGLDLALGHSPFEGVMNTMQNLSALDLEFLGWGAGSLALLWCALFYSRSDRGGWAMFAVIATILVAMFFYWFAGSFYVGPRYWFMMLFPIAVLSALGFQGLSARLETMGVPRARSVSVLLGLAAFSFLVATPWRGVEKYHAFRETTTVARDAGAASDELVFVTFDSPGSALFLNDPFLRNDATIYLQDKGEEANAAAISLYPDRTVRYLNDGL